MDWPCSLLMTDWRVKIIILPRVKARTRRFLSAKLSLLVSCTRGWYFASWKRLHDVVLSTQTGLCSLCVRVWTCIRVGSWLSALWGHTVLITSVILSTFAEPLPPHSTYAWFLTGLLLHTNAIRWISYHWMEWFGSRSVSSPCLWGACSVLVSTVYLWAGLGPALLIIHETSTARKRSQHHAGSVSQPTAGVTGIFQFYIDYKSKMWARKSINQHQEISLCHWMSFSLDLLFDFANGWSPNNLLCLIIQPPIIYPFILTWETCCFSCEIAHEITAHYIQSC